jgi:outer membrane protein TolC
VVEGSLKKLTFRIVIIFCCYGYSSLQFFGNSGNKEKPSMQIWKRILRIIIITSFWMAPMLSLATVVTSAQLPSEEMQRLTREMLANNQELSALEQKVAAMKLEVSAAGALEDPRLGFGLLNLPSDSLQFDEAPMTQKQISLTQRIPWLGKRDLKTQHAVLNALRQESILNTRRLKLIRDLTDAYYELGFVAESQDINIRLSDHLDQIVRVAEARYGLGKGLQQDILQAQVEQSRLMDSQNRLKQQRRSLEDRINSLLNRSEYAPISGPVPTDLPDLGASIEKWQAVALDANPDLQTRRIEIEQAKVNVALSRKAYYPDPDLKLAYGQRDADTNGNDRSDFISASVTFSLPVWAKRKQRKRWKAEKKRHDAARSIYRDLASQIPHEVDAVAAQLLQLKENYTLYKEVILIQASQWAESARFSYEVGKVNFNTMVSAQLQELQLERQAKQYLYQFYRKMAALDLLLGRRLHVKDSDSTDRIKPQVRQYPKYEQN